MKQTTLKEKLFIAVSAAVVSLLVIMFGIRLMGKVIDFAYWEREHVIAVANFDVELNKPEPSRDVLLKNAKYARSQATFVINAVFPVEKLLFRLVGQGLLLDLAEEDIVRLSEIIKFLQNKQKTLSSTETKQLEKMISWSLEQTDVFGSGLRQAASVVKFIVVTLNILCIGSVIFMILYTMKTNIPKLESTAEIAQHIANGNLDVDLTGEHIEPPTKNMVVGLRKLICNIRIAMEELQVAAEKSSTITEQTLAGVTKQRNELAELSGSVSEMSGSTDSIAQAAHAANDAAQIGNSASTKGERVVIDAVSSMKTMAEQVETSAHAIKEIEINSENIRSVVNLINDITEQTNLLALNAAIEAARAGEHGRGFAVVADEVRSLAKRTQDFTQEIQNTIDSLVSSTRSAVDTMDSCKQLASESVKEASTVVAVIGEMKLGMDNILGLNEQIASAADQQNMVTQSINANTQEINTVAEETATGAKDATKHGEELVKVVQQLNQTIERFSV